MPQVAELSRKLNSLAASPRAVQHARRIMQAVMLLQCLARLVFRLAKKGVKKLMAIKLVCRLLCIVSSTLSLPYTTSIWPSTARASQPAQLSRHSVEPMSELPGCGCSCCRCCTIFAAYRPYHDLSLCEHQQSCRHICWHLDSKRCEFA